MTTRKKEQEIEENLSESESIFGDSDSSSDEEEEENNKQNSHTNNTNTTTSTTATTKAADTNSMADTIKEELSIGSRVNIIIEEDSGNVSYPATVIEVKDDAMKSLMYCMMDTFNYGDLMDFKILIIS